MEDDDLLTGVAMKWFGKFKIKRIQNVYQGRYYHIRNVSKQTFSHKKNIGHLLNGLAYWSHVH